MLSIIMSCTYLAHHELESVFIIIIIIIKVNRFLCSTLALVVDIQATYIVVCYHNN